MRVVIFWTMCHHSLGHEKKALLSFQDGQFDQVVSYMSVDPTSGEDRSHSDYPDAPQSRPTGTTVI